MPKKRKPGAKPKSLLQQSSALDLVQEEGTLIAAMSKSLTQAQARIHKPVKGDKWTEEGLRAIIEDHSQLFTNIKQFIILLNQKELSAVNLDKTLQFLNDYRAFILWFGDQLTQKKRLYENLVAEIVKYSLFLMKALSFHPVFSESKVPVPQFGVLRELDKIFTLPYTEKMKGQLENRKKKPLTKKFSEEFLTTTFNGANYAAIDDILMESFSDSLADYGFEIGKEKKSDSDSNVDSTQYQKLFLTYTGESVPKSFIHRDHLNAYVHVLNDASSHTELMGICGRYYEKWQNEKSPGSDTTAIKVQLINDEGTVVETLSFELKDLFIVGKPNNDGTREIAHTVLLRTLLYNNLPNLGLLPCYTNTGKNKKTFTNFIKEQPYFSQFFNYIKKEFRIDFVYEWARRKHLFSLEINDGADTHSYDLALFLSKYADISEHLGFLNYFSDHIHQIFHAKVAQSRTPQVSPNNSPAFDMDDNVDEKGEPKEFSASDIARANQILLRNVFERINKAFYTWPSDQQAILNFAYEQDPEQGSQILLDMRKNYQNYQSNIDEILTSSSFLSEIGFSDIIDQQEQQVAVAEDSLPSVADLSPASLPTTQGPQEEAPSSSFSSGHTFFAVGDSNNSVGSSTELDTNVDANVLTTSINQVNIGPTP